MWSHLIEQLGPHLPTVLISGFFGVGVAGVYNLVYRIIARPAYVFGTAAQVMIMSEASKRLRARNELMPVFRTATRRLGALALAIFIPAAILGPIILPHILGPGWQDSGRFLLAIIPAVCVDFIVVPVIPLLGLVERAWSQLAISGSRLLLVALAIVGSATIGAGPTMMLVLVSAAVVAVDAAAFVSSRRAISMEQAS